MLSIAAMGKGQHAYYTDLAYYSKDAPEQERKQGGEPVGRWWGGAVSHLGLGQEVKPDELRRIFDGKHPTKRRVPDLVRNAGNPGRRPGWDFTFSAPKSVSLLWANASPAVQAKIEDIQRRACESALSYLEEQTGFVRTGKAGAVLHPAKWAVAMFEHGTSRALDAQLHTHCLLMNAGLRNDGLMGTLASKQFYYGKMVAGAVYRADLAHLLTSELGVVCEPSRVGFHIVGVPEELIAASSKRREVIEAELGASTSETASAAAFAAAAKATRSAKSVVPPRENLFKRWQEEGRKYKFHAEDVLGKTKIRRPKINRALRAVLEQVTSNRASFTRDMFVRAAADMLVATPLDSKTLLNAVDKFLTKEKTIVALDLGDQQRYTTKAILQEERKLIREATRLTRTKGVGAAAVDIEKVLASYSKPRSVIWGVVRHHTKQLAREFLKQKTVPFDYEAIKKETSFVLSDEQKGALRELSRDSKSSLRVLEAGSGTGKTKMLSVVREVLEKEGLRVIGVALSGKAARGLQEEAGIPSQTYAMLSSIIQPPTVGERLVHGTVQLFRAAVQKPTYNLEKFQFDKNTVLVVDEASMLNNEELTVLLTEARKASATVVLVGDRNQLQAIGRGGGLAYISDRFGAATLKENLRQQDPADRVMLEKLLNGEGGAVLKSLDERGRLHQAPTRDEAMKNLVSDWARREEGRRDSAFIFASTNEQVDSLNKACQESRLASGEINKKRVAIGEDNCVLYRGDRVMITKGSKSLDLANGDCGVISKIVGFGMSKVVVIELDRGKTVEIPLSSFNHLCLGYAMTTHKGQGQTSQASYILAGGSMQDREISYVQLSRARGETHVYVSQRDAVELAEQIERSRQQEMLAAEERRRRQQQEADLLRRRKR